MPHKDPEVAREYQRQHRLKHRERLNEYTRLWRLAHPEMPGEYSRRRRERDPEKVRAENQKYREANEEKVKEYMREWRANNREKTRAYRHAARTRQREAEGTFTADEFLALCKRYNNCCAYCGTDGKMTIDHVVPLSRGGSNYISNILPACALCNHRKRARTLSEFLGTDFSGTDEITVSGSDGGEDKGTGHRLRLGRFSPPGRSRPSPVPQPPCRGRPLQGGA